MVSCKLYGRLGNQMFQIAAALGYSEDYDVPFVLPDKTLNEAVWPNYFKGKFASRSLYENAFNSHYKESIHSYLKIPKLEGHVMLDGYFQSYRYFDRHLEKVRKAFEFSDLYFLPRTVSIHVRRGDYLQHPTKHPVVTLDYLYQAIRWFDPAQNNFFIFSDDLPWCRSNMPQLFRVDQNYRFVEAGNPIEDMKSMSMCESNIVSNSSFSVMAAILNSNQWKKVVCPHEESYFGVDNKHLNVSTTMPPDWLRIKF